MVRDDGFENSVLDSVADGVEQQGIPELLLD